MGIGPFELLIGREFKLPLWEDMIKTMKVGEISRFGCEFRVSSFNRAFSARILHIRTPICTFSRCHVCTYCTLYQYCDEYGAYVSMYVMYMCNVSFGCIYIRTYTSFASYMYFYLHYIYTYTCTVYILKH